MSYALYTQDMVVSTNVALKSITLVVRIPTSPFVVHGEKSKIFNGLNLRI